MSGELRRHSPVPLLHVHSNDTQDLEHVCFVRDNLHHIIALWEFYESHKMPHALNVKSKIPQPLPEYGLNDQSEVVIF